MIDVLDAGAVGREQRDRVVHFVDPQQRRFTDAVAHARVADLGPERLVARRVRRAQADMTKVGDAGVARAMVAHAAVGGPPHQLDPVAARVVEGDELAHFARLRLARRAGAHRVAEPFEFAGRRGQRRARGDLEGDGLLARVALEVAQRVLALVGLEIDRAFGDLADLEAEHVGGKAGRALDVARAKPHIADALQVDHGRRLRYQSSLTANSGTVLSLPQAQNERRLRGNWRGRWAALSATTVPSAT